MKRILAITLALMLVLSLCACGGDEPIRGEQIDNNNAEPTVDDVTEDVTQETEPEETEPEETEAEGLKLGVSSGLTYESEFVGIGCTLPEDWSFYTDEQMRQLNNIAIDAAGEELQSLMENASVIYDMFASDATGANNINVNLEKLNPVQLIALDLEQNLENTIPLLKTSFENMGSTAVDCQIGTITIGGEEFVCMNNVIDFPGTVVYQCLIPVKCSGYLANISVSANSEEILSEVLSYLYLVD